MESSLNYYNNSFRRTLNNRSSKECQICYESHPRSLFLEITANCKHRSNVCKLCVDKHISTRLNSGIEINCLFDGCRQILQHDDIKRLASKETFERFDTLSFRQALNEMPEFRWCKSSGCGYGQIHFERGNNDFK